MLRSYVCLCLCVTATAAVDDVTVEKAAAAAHTIELRRGGNAADNRQCTSRCVAVARVQLEAAAAASDEN